MYLLDTNIVSMLDPRRSGHAPSLLEWLERNGGSLFISVMTVAEMDSGVLKLRREGKNQRADEIAELVAASSPILATGFSRWMSKPPVISHGSAR